MTEQIYTFNLPDIGEGVVEGEVIEWLKKVGDPVKKDEPVVVVMTDKATVELPAPYPGIISRHYFKPGEISIKDKPLYDITLEPGQGQIPQEKQSHQIPQPRLDAILAKTDHSKCSEKSLQTGKVLAKPKTRKLAKDFGIDMSSIKPSGEHGEVTLEDLKATPTCARVQEPHPPLEGDEDHPLIGIQGLMARKMDRGYIPQFSYFEQVDATRLVQLRDKSKIIAEREGMPLSFMPFFMRALVLVAKEYPLLNSSIDMERGVITIHKQMNLGTAMATPHGLIVPVLKGVEKMTLNEIIHAYHEIKGRAQNGKLSNADMHGATLTLSNYGAVGEGRWATPMVSPPEVAILAVARITKTPVVRNDEIVIREILNLSWSFDHRVIDGELAAKISGSMSKYIKDPAQLL